MNWATPDTRFPRTSGDRPYCEGDLITTVWVSPHERGRSGTLSAKRCKETPMQDRHPRGMVLPARNPRHRLPDAPRSSSSMCRSPDFQGNPHRLIGSTNSSAKWEHHCRGDDSVTLEVFHLLHQSSARCASSFVQLRMKNVRVEIMRHRTAAQVRSPNLSCQWRTSALCPPPK